MDGIFTTESTTESTPMTRGFGKIGRPTRFEDIEETLVKKLLKDIKPGEKRLLKRTVEEIKKAPNIKRLKEISLAIGIMGIGTLGITGYILLNRFLNEKMNKLSK